MIKGLRLLQRAAEGLAEGELRDENKSIHAVEEK